MNKNLDLGVGYSNIRVYLTTAAFAEAWAAGSRINEFVAQNVDQ